MSDWVFWVLVVVGIFVAYLTHRGDQILDAECHAAGGVYHNRICLEPDAVREEFYNDRL
jgi:uncharacterized membrane protein (DUF441 family)